MCVLNYVQFNFIFIFFVANYLKCSNFVFNELVVFRLSQILKFHLMNFCGKFILKCFKILSKEILFEIVSKNILKLYLMNFCCNLSQKCVEILLSNELIIFNLISNGFKISTLKGNGVSRPRLIHQQFGWWPNFEMDDFGQWYQYMVYILYHTLGLSFHIDKNK